MTAQKDPLIRQIEAVTFTDGEIKRIMNLAAAEVGSMSTEAAVRSAQKGLANLAVQTWGDVGDAVKVGISDAAWNATEFQALFDEELFTKAGVSSRYWRASMFATAQEGVQNVISRKENGIALSDRIWKNSKIAQQGLNDTINVGLALGKSPQEIAASVKGYLRPDVPGGASAAALRLGRSEVLNAYHTTTVRGYKATPWIERAQWNLSGSHPRPDKCNEYAEHSAGPKWPAGTYLIDQIPDKPHPNCLCFVTPVQLDLDTYVKNFKAGKYDDYIEKQMGCYRNG